MRYNFWKVDLRVILFFGVAFSAFYEYGAGNIQSVLYHALAIGVLLLVVVGFRFHQRFRMLKNDNQDLQSRNSRMSQRSQIEFDERMELEASLKKLQKKFENQSKKKK